MRQVFQRSWTIATPAECGNRRGVTCLRRTCRRRIKPREPAWKLIRGDVWQCMTCTPVPSLLDPKERAAVEAEERRASESAKRRNRWWEALPWGKGREGGQKSGDDSGTGREGER